MYTYECRKSVGGWKLVVTGIDTHMAGTFVGVLSKGDCLGKRGKV